MLLRSSSTPILGSLLSSSSSSSSPHPFNDSPNTHHHHPLDKAPSIPSPIGFRRARSDGNLHSLHSPSPDHHRPHPPSLRTIPSFSFSGSKEQEGEEEEEEGGDEERRGSMSRRVSAEFSFVGRDQNLSLVVGLRDDGGSSAAAALPLFLARGLGIDRLGSGLLTAGGGGGGGDAGGGGGAGNGGGWERSDVEMYYKRMVEENPSSALFLSNYAKFLYETKGDAQRAEEYYSRAILAEPRDGEILSEYAKLVWELHHDKERASSYFEQAVRASPNDSYVLGACANFLWETEAEDGDGGVEDAEFGDCFGATVRREVMA